MEIRNSLASIGRILLKFGILFLTLVISILLIVLVIVPLHSIRQIVGFLAKFFHPEYVCLVSTRSSVWTIDKLYTSPQSNITIIAIFAKKIEHARLCEDFSAKVISKYPRLRQYFESWLGYSFWKWDEVFDTKRHLITLNSPVIGQNELLLEANNINTRAWTENKSPWCGVFVEDYREHAHTESTCAWIFNIHHSLSDALGAQCILLNLVGEDTSHKRQFNDITLELTDQNVDNLALILKFIPSIYKFVTSLLTIKDSNDLRRFGSQISKDREIQYFRHSTNGEVSIPFARIQEIQDRFNVSTTAVMGALAGRCLERLCAKDMLKVPPSVHLMLPFSHPGHSRQATNHQAFVFIEVPIGSASGITRLRAIENEVTLQREAGISNIFASLVPLVLGSMPGFLTNYVYKVDLPTGMLISITADQPIRFQGVDVTDLSFISGPLPGNQGIFFFFMKYAEKFKIGMALSTSFTKLNVKMETLLQNMADEVNNLLATA